LNSLADAKFKKLKQYDNFGVYEIENASLIDIAVQGFTLSPKRKD